MVINAKVIARLLTALAVGLVLVAHSRAGTPDRTLRFGDDPAEAPTARRHAERARIGALTLDSQVFNTVAGSPTRPTSALPAGRPTLMQAPGRWPGPARLPARSGCSSMAQAMCSSTLDRGLGVPAQADDNYGSGTNNAPGYANITTRYIDGWVRPTGGAGTRRDVINDTARFGIFIGTDNNWGFRNGTTTVNTTTAAPLNTWTHVMHRTFGAGGGAALLVNGIAVAATPNGYATGAQAAADLPIVFGAGLNQTSNFFAGQLDDFVLGVAGNNTGQPGGRDYGALTLATDNAFIRQNLMGVNAGDINRDGIGQQHRHEYVRYQLAASSAGERRHSGRPEFTAVRRPEHERHGRHRRCLHAPFCTACGRGWRRLGFRPAGRRPSRPALH